MYLRDINRIISSLAGGLVIRGIVIDRSACWRASCQVGSMAIWQLRADSKDILMVTCKNCHFLKLQLVCHQLSRTEWSVLKCELSSKPRNYRRFWQRIGVPTRKIKWVEALRSNYFLKSVAFDHFHYFDFAIFVEHNTKNQVCQSLIRNCQRHQRRLHNSDPLLHMMI